MSKRKTTKDGQLYTCDDQGVVHQLYYDLYNYDKEYVQTYDTPEYKQASEVLNNIRFAFVCGALGREPNSILDFGYGNGDFLKVAHRHGVNAVGFDLTGVEIEGITTYKDTLPEKVGREVVTFWDAIEHVEFMKTVINADFCPYFVAVTVPCLPIPFSNDEFEDVFSDWKHRKPNEHLHHFTPLSLKLFMQKQGYKLLSLCHIEDYVRVNKDCKPNTVTAFFVREDAYL